MRPTKEEDTHRARYSAIVVVKGAARNLEINFTFGYRLWKPAGLPTYKASTRQQCELALKNYLIPQFGHQKFREITKAEAQAFVGKMLNTLAPDTVHGIHRYLRRVRASAVEWFTRPVISNCHVLASIRGRS